MLAPDGSLHGAYRKVHLFSAEREAFTPGAEPALFDIAGTRVALTICYDLIFPEYIRRLVLEGAQVILNSTDWITNDWQRSLGWGGNVVAGLVATRALENTVHVAMADRVGVEEGWKSLGHSCIAAPSGAHLAKNRRWRRRRGGCARTRSSRLATMAHHSDVLGRPAAGPLHTWKGLTMDIRTYLCQEARRMHADSLQRKEPAGADWPQAREQWLARYYEMMGVTSHMALTERPH